MQNAGDGVSLNHVAGPETGKTRKDGKRTCKPPPLRTQTVSYVVHRAAYDIPGRRGFTKMHCQNNLGKLRCHTDQGRAPHPEKGSRAPCHQGRGHTDNRAGTDSACHSRHQGGKCRDFSFTALTFTGPRKQHTKSRRDVAERISAQTDGQINTGTDKEKQHNRAPDKSADGPEYRNDCLHCPSPPKNSQTEIKSIKDGL